MSSAASENVPKSVKEIWEKTIIHFQERTGQRLDAVLKSPDDLRKALNSHYDEQADDPGIAKAKDVGFKMIACFELLGGIAAQGASMVFGPASLCFNALSFLLTIPKKVHEFHGEVNAIFAEVGPALAHFRIYQRMEDVSEIDEALRVSIYEVMMSFVDLCANCINIHYEGKWKSLKRHAKRVLLDDQSVKGALDHFKRLTQDQQNLQATLTLEAAIETNQHVTFIKATTVEIDANTKTIKSDVSGLVEAERKRSLDEVRKKHLSTIKGKLALKDDMLGNAIDARENMWKNSNKESGKWLNDLDKYKTWIDRSNTETDSVLLLSGDPGTGKSYLVSAITQEIKSQNSATRAERNLIGYYCFTVSGKNDERQRPESAIKSIAAQLAEQDIVYAKHVAGICAEPSHDEKFFRDASCSDLWKTLCIGSPAKNTTHYILLDSVSTLSMPEIERLITAIQQPPVIDLTERSSRIRILISAEPKLLQEESINVTSIPTIDITEHNNVDISIFIDEELKRAELFQGEDDDSLRLRTTVQERLLKRSNNNYTVVKQDLGKVKDIINSSGTEDELNRVLHETSTDPEALVRSDIETLEATLKAREIDEINELLIWTIAGHGYFDLDELAAALFLRFNTVSLQPLEQKIAGKYSKIFSYQPSQGFLMLKDYIEECVVVERDKPRQSAEEPKITATITITNGDVQAVQRFFWDLNHYSFLDGFAFRPGADLSETSQRRIRLYRVDAHLDILKRAFDFILQPPVDDRGKGIGRYLLAYMTKHLQALYEATGLDELQPADKQYIGSNIYDLFNEGDLIEKNLEYCTWVRWFQSSEDMAIFWKWLGDPVATARLGPRDKRWLAELKKERNPNRSLLTPIMTMIARKWLQGDELDVAEASMWIKGFLSLGTAEESAEDNSAGASEPLEQQSTKNDEGDDQYVAIRPNDVMVEQIKKAERWCKQVLSIDKVDYLWHKRMGLTYAAMDELDPAIEEFKQAVEILQSQDPVDKEALQFAYKNLADWSSDIDISLEYYKQAQEQDPFNVEIMYAYLKRCVSSQKDEAAQPIILRAATEKIPDTESTLLFSLINSAASDSNENESFSIFRALFSLTSSAPELWATLQCEMNSAIQKAREENKYAQLSILLSDLGSAMYYYHREEASGGPAKAVELWRESLATIEKLEQSDREQQLVSSEQRTLSYLSMYYFEQAIHEQTGNPEEAEQKLREISENDRAASTTKYTLASYYTFLGHNDKARNLLRSEIVTAFNILTDDDVENDGEGYIALGRILKHAGDYEGALTAYRLLPTWSFDEEVLKGFLASEKNLTEEAASTILGLYQAHCPPSQTQYGNLMTLMTQIEKLMTSGEEEEGEEDRKTEERSQYAAIHKALGDLSNMIDFHMWCNNCHKYWDNETALHSCKYCYDMDLCDDCWNDLRAGKTGSVLACSKTHDWWVMEPWTMEQRIRGCRKRILVKNSEDAGEETIDAAQWVSNLCEQWGLSKDEWKFEY